ncbi:MAG: hypothetical protein GY810_28210 [Aureispira sp.]|nr:hypothetical protein [Aureispira sp.]
MATQNFHNPKTFFNYIYAIVSLTFMLYWLGILGSVLIYTSNLLTYFRENIPFYIELKDNAPEADVFKYQKKLEVSEFVKKGSVRYISKEEAVEELEGDDLLSKDDLMLFGENLLPNMIAFHMRGDFVTSNEEIIAEIRTMGFVEDVFHMEGATRNISTNLYRVGLIVLVLVIFFIFVAITLIKNTLKLMILSNKQLIQTMQLVGSNWEYMSKPYLQQSIRNALFSSGIAIVAILITIWIAQSQIDGLSHFASASSFVGLSVVLIIVSMLVSWGSTRHSINKYMRVPTNQWMI